MLIRERTALILEGIVQSGFVVQQIRWKDPTRLSTGHLKYARNQS